MRTILANQVGRPASTRASQQGSVRILLLVLVCFLLGLGVGWLAFHHGTPLASAKAGAATGGEQAAALSASTEALLQRLNTPVEIHYYSLLAPSSTSAALRDFARRVGRMLSEYQRKSRGMIQVTRHSALTDSDANDASADGIQPFNLDKGTACYLGIAVVHDHHKVSLPRLSLEWQQAVEYDVSRAIERALRPQPPAHPLPASSPVSRAAVRQVKQLIPNLDSVSVKEGTDRLRKAALEEFKAATQKTTAEVKQARQRLSQAQTPSEQEAAMKDLRQVQSEGTRRLQEIAARLQVQIKALKQIKSE